jgi:hypothetical protein
MKRRFGKKLIEEFFPMVDLTHIIDTSGAHIPGHGTPTVILIGQRRWPRQESTVRAVINIRGEANGSRDAAQWNVWAAIVDQTDHPDSASAWVTVANIQRSQLTTHPWVLTGGGAALTKVLQTAAVNTIGAVAEAIGLISSSGDDDAYFRPPKVAKRQNVETAIPLVIGDAVRDFAAVPTLETIWPYDESFRPIDTATTPGLLHALWPNRRSLRNRKRFGTVVESIPGFLWYEYKEFYAAKLQTPLALTHAYKSTHNHFALIRDFRIQNRHAPVIKLPATATVDEYLGILGILNSSAGCFWLKQVNQDTGNRGGERSSGRYAWERYFEFTGTNLKKYPLPSDLPIEFARELDRLAQALSSAEPSAVCANGVPTRERLNAAQAEYGHIRGRMIALQEELDWDVYRRYGLLNDAEAAELTANSETIPELALGQRAFEIAIAPSAADDEAVAQWFVRHGSVLVTEIPPEFPEPYRRVMERRIEAIKHRHDIALVERPEFKRRWQSESWEKRERAALRAWLLDRCEYRSLWYSPDGQGNAQPRPMTVNRLADKLRADPDFVSVAHLLAGPDADFTEVLTDITANEHVPCLAQLRYKESGLRTRMQWEQVWDLQRREDRDGTRLDIPAPPKYVSGDFIRPSYWRNRGKLDVPKERFISYPRASPDGDSSLLLGWAGWDHREQGHALMTLIDERVTKDGWDGPRLIPLIAALAEVMPWVRQWHSEVDAEFGTSPAQAYDTYLDEQKLTYGFSDDDLRGWKPPPRGRRHADEAAPEDKDANKGFGEEYEPEELEGDEIAP